MHAPPIPTIDYYYARGVTITNKVDEIPETIYLYSVLSRSQYVNLAFNASLKINGRIQIDDC